MAPGTDKKINIKLVSSLSHDPWFNLAVEEYLFDSAEDDTVILYLWQNQNTVVIGKSQNAWKECRVTELESDGGRLARRSSGGGAVYQDLGNMCYTFITSSGLYDLEKHLSVIIGAVKRCGIDAHFTGRNDIVTADGRKFSGNAFRFVKDTGLMHGTLLLDTDSSKMARYLNVSKAKMQAKGVDSVRSRVVNLCELNPDISPSLMAQALKESFRDIYGAWQCEYTFSEDSAPAAVRPLYDKYSSWEWRLGETPEFNSSFESRFSWGGIEVFMTAEKGIIGNIEIYTDAMDASLADILKSSLQGCRLSYEDIDRCVRSAVALLAAGGKMIADPREAAEDIISCFASVL